MSDLRKAAEMALETLCVGVNDAVPNDIDERFEQAIQALRQALAQPEQEPVVGMFEEKLPDQNPPPWSRSYRLKREWVGLTDNEVEQIGEHYFQDRLVTIEEAIRHVESVLKEKNA